MRYSYFNRQKIKNIDILRYILESGSIEVIVLSSLPSIEALQMARRCGLEYKMMGDGAI